MFLSERNDEFALVEDERGARLALGFDGKANRGDLCRCGATAAANDSRSEISCVCGEFSEVLRRRMRERDP